MSLAMLYVSLMGSGLLGQTGECRTPLGVPCYTMESRTTEWTLFETGLTDISRKITYSVGALRRDGSQAAMDLGEQREPQRQWISVPPTGQQFAISPKRREATVTPVAAPRRNAEPGDATCLTGMPLSMPGPPGSTYVGPDRILGVAVVVYRRAGASWRNLQEIAMAPSLDCLVLRTVSRHIPDLLGGEKGQVSVTEVVSIKWGEPDAKLFAVPTGYRVVQPPAYQNGVDALNKYDPSAWGWFPRR